MNRLFIIIMFLLSGFALAAEPVPGKREPVRDAGELYLKEKRKEQELETLRKRQESAKESPTLKPVQKEDACFLVHSIAISGNTLLSKDEVGEVVSYYKDKCLGKNAINELMKYLTALYVDKGYITSRVYIPPQDLTTGMLNLVVIEGYVESISINNNSEADRRKLWWAISNEWGRHLRLPEIEQGLDQINSVPSANAEMKLWPGSKSGATRIHISNTVNNKYRGQLQISNDGQENTGKNKVRFGVSADNLLGINDTSSVNLITSTNTHAASVSGAFPFRWWKFNLSHSYSEYLNILPGNTDLFGQSNTTSVLSEYLLHRNSKTRFNLQAGFTVRRSERYVLGNRLKPQKLVPFRAAVNVSSNHTWGFYSVELAHITGTELFGASKDDDDSPAGSPEAQFSKWEVQGTLVKPVFSGLSWQTSLSGQYSNDYLYSSEQLHLGDRSTIRGTDTTIISGERGFYIRSTLSWPLALLVDGRDSIWNWLSRTTLSVFSDYGQARLLQDHSQGATSAGTRLNARYRQFSGALSWAKIVNSRAEAAGQNSFYISLIWDMF